MSAGTGATRDPNDPPPPRPEAGSPGSEAVLAALAERRSVFRFRDETVPPVLVERALDAGRWAPNHKLTEPWRFTILGPRTREAAAPLYARTKLRKLPPDAPEERVRQVLSLATAKWQSKPVVVAVSQTPEEDPLRREEDYASVACAIQNIQLAAWALGLGSQWSTSSVIQDPEAMGLAGIPPEERVVGLVFLGWPEEVRPSRRKPLSQVLRTTP